MARGWPRRPCGIADEAEHERRRRGVEAAGDLRARDVGERDAGLRAEGAGAAHGPAQSATAAPHCIVAMGGRSRRRKARSSGSKVRWMH